MKGRIVLKIAVYIMVSVMMLGLTPQPVWGIELIKVDPDLNWSS